MSALRYAAIAFDFDGVLVESVDVKTRAFADLYAPYGESVVARVVAYHLAHGGVSRFEKFRHFHREFLGRPLAADEEAALGERFSALVEDAVVAAPMVAGAAEFLSAYHARLPLYVVSGTPDEELKRIVARRRLGAYFRAVFGSPRGKAELLAGIAAAEGIEADRMLMVGDATTDYDGAAGTGTAFVGRIASGHGSPFPPDTMVVADLHELPALL